jgi:hypothetical protein
VPDGIPVTFTPDGLGSVDPPDAATTAGTAATTFFAGTVPGTSVESVTVDGQTVPVSINVVEALTGVAVTSPVNEGGLVDLTGLLHDAGTGDSYTLEVNWGDTAPDGGPDTQQFSYAPGTPSFDVQHTYEDHSPAGQAYPVTLTLIDNVTGHVAAVTTTAVQVNDLPPTPTILDAPDTSPEGTPIGLTADVSDPGAADTAAGFQYAWTVTVGGQTFATGTDPDFTFVPSPGGTYVVTLAVTDQDGAVGTDTRTITVESLTALALTSSANPAVVGQQVIFTAQVTTLPGDPGPTGAVDFLDGTTGADLGTYPLVNGQASATTSALGLGGHTIIATYLPDDGFVTSGNSVTEDVRADVTSQLSIQDSGAFYNRRDRLFHGGLTLTNISNAAIAGSLVIQLQGLTAGVMLQSATVTLDGQTYQLPVDNSDVSNPSITLSQSLLASLAPGQSLALSVAFSDPAFALIDFNAKVFSDLTIP